MFNKLISVNLIIFILLFASHCGTNNQTKPELLINFSSDVTLDPHSGLMGLHLAQKALSNQIGVTVFLNVHGVKLMGAGGDQITFHNEKLYDVLKDILDKGGDVMICPHCMKAHGIKESDLLKGVKLGEESIMMKKIKQNPTVFTY